jgi:hypothetical protein
MLSNIELGILSEIGERLVIYLRPPPDTIKFVKRTLALDGLEERGFVEKYKDGSNGYVITPAGRAVLEAEVGK